MCVCMHVDFVDRACLGILDFGFWILSYSFLGGFFFLSP